MFNFKNKLLRNKIKVARRTSHMMIIVVYVFYRQQTLRTSEMSLIFNNFQFIYIYEWRVDSLSLTFVSHLLVDHMKLVYTSHLSSIVSFSFRRVKRTKRRRRSHEWSFERWMIENGMSIKIYSTVSITQSL